MNNNDVIENLLTGERLTVIESAGNGSDDFIYEYACLPRTPTAPEHLHPIAEESFEVVQGVMTCRINGIERTFTAGEKAIIPPGTPHTGWNSGTGELILRAKISPGMNFEQYYRTIFYLSKQNKTNEHGVPGLLHLAAISFNMKNQTFYPKYIFLQKLYINLAGPVGNWLGYKADYK
ncbi:cupin domain-containing protein [Paenibacillus typhae]|uniref:Cupin domain-containing protein n=1 Tax=Paenibacillus typhae TaxID=1174501 RepID=A0A1G8F8R6_9BACL|nr:cupin domain-containing protein [Paenibacillus typhae]SDH78465.1 Cupin domain-containing protein [Paenibacillus typhae]